MQRNRWTEGKFDAFRKIPEFAALGKLQHEARRSHAQCGDFWPVVSRCYGPGKKSPASPAPMVVVGKGIRRPIPPEKDSIASLYSLTALDNERSLRISRIPFSYPMTRFLL